MHGGAPTSGRPSLKLGFKKSSTLDDFEKKFEIGTQLGEGGYGTVFMCQKKSNSQCYAAKFIANNIMHSDQTKIKNEINLLKIIQASKNQHCLQLEGIYKGKNGEDVIVTEMLSGGDLFDEIEQKRLICELHALNIISTILKTVQKLHEENILHLDLKPENIMYRTTETETTCDNSYLKASNVVIIDYGLGCTIDEPPTDFRGSPDYISPDALNYNYVPGCDVWSCGVILYIMLCGFTPFENPDSNDNWHTLFNNIRNLNYGFHDAAWVSISQETKDIISQMMRPAAEQTPIEELLELIDAQMQHFSN